MIRSAITTVAVTSTTNTARRAILTEAWTTESFNGLRYRGMLVSRGRRHREEITLSRLMMRPRTLIAAVCGAGLAFGVGYAVAAQPHMQAALAALQNAKAELQAAIPDKGGHRVKAIALVDEAIGEVRAGIA